MAVFETYPNTTATGNGMKAWEQWGATLRPDAIISGLQVTKVGPLRVRMAPGRAVCGGYIMVLTEELFYNVPPNLAGGTRIDRWVLERFVVGDQVVVEPAVLPGNPPIGPALTQLGLPNSWMIPVARWAVTSAANDVQFLTNDGPGAGLAVWARDAYGFIDNRDDGVPDLYAARLPQRGRGPEPASVDGRNFNITIPGLYLASYSVYLREAATALQAAAKPYIRLKLGEETEIVQPFNLGGTGPPQHGRARIVEPFAVNTVPYVVEPRLYQNSGDTQSIDWIFKLEREAA